VSQSINKLASLIIKALEDDIVNGSDLFNEEKKFIDKLKTLILQRAKEFKLIALQMSSITY